MKIIRYISGLCLALSVCSACDSDLEKVYYDEEEVTPTVLSGIDGAYVLDANRAQAVAIEFDWTKPEAGYQAKIVNTLQMDLKGKNFGKAVALHSSTEKGPYAVTVKDLNDRITKLLQAYELEVAMQPYDLEFRIASSISDAAGSFYSNVESSQITPFIGEPEYPKVYLPGAYCGWGEPKDSFSQCQLLYSLQDDGVYEGWVVFGTQTIEGWKITPEASWNVSWGYDGKEAMNPTSLTLAAGAGNIACYDKFSYKFSFNRETLELSVKASADTWGICGTHTNWEGEDTPMTLAYETDASGNRAYYLTATVTLAAGSEWKIRADQAWDNQFASNAVEGDFEAGDGDNFKVSEAGIYIIKLYFNKVKPEVVVIKE